MNSRSKLIIFVAVLASLLEIIDTSIVNVALPTMMGNLGATLEDISMVITGYAIANAIVLPASAYFSERFGRRRYYLGCIFAFTLSSVACGLAPNLITLIIFRIVQGAMGGALLPTSQALIYEQFPKEKAGIAGAIFGMSVMIGPTLGPVMGGFLTDNLGWRSIFNINLPLGILALFVGLACIFDREKSDHEKLQSMKFDGIGFGLLVLGIGCLQFVLERGNSNDWFSSTSIVIGSILALISLPAFVWWELKVPNPIINIRLLANPIVLNGIGLMMCLGFFLYSIVFLLPVFLTRSFHYTATQTGAFFIPGSILTAVMMPVVGKLMSSGKNPKALIVIGLLSLELCCFLMTGLSPFSPKDQILNLLFVRGFALAFLFVPINSSILSQFKGVNLGQVSGLMNLSRQLGGSTGIALGATLLTQFMHQNFTNISAKVSLLSPATQQAFGQSSNGMAGKMSEMVGLGSGASAALKALAFRVENQVFMVSFIQLIWVIMIIFAFSFIPLYMLRLNTKPTGPVDSH